MARVDTGTGMVARRCKQRWCRDTVDTTRQGIQWMSPQQVTLQESLSENQSVHELDYSLLRDFRAS